jgi:hypothetical protein
MKMFCMNAALLMSTVVVMASDNQKTNKPKPNPNIERVKKNDHPSNIDRSAGKHVTNKVISSASRNNRVQSTPQPPKAKNQNT